ncbi:MAG: flavodoxin, partial [Clostridiales bacterium]|nr:flavodoxin [Clostridiales bacterium]
KTAVVYWSGTGNTEMMAGKVADGAKAAGADVTVMTASEFSAAKAAEFDAIAFGCPSMGDEQLEESEFEPMWSEVKGAIAGKKVALFGSFGWGDGQWMRTWEDDCSTSGIRLACDSVICCGAPDDAASAELENIGKALA